MPLGPAGGILWDMQNDARKLKERDALKENAGKLLVDLAKLIFGSMFLAGILQGELPRVIMIVGGFALVVMFSAIGLHWISKSKGD